MEIVNDRIMKDGANLDSRHWKGMQQGIDGYPIKDKYGHYCIAGGKDLMFKAQSIEIYGVKLTNKL